MEKYAELVRLIARDIDLSPPRQSSPASHASLLKGLKNAISQLMDTSMERLLSILYRLDIDEAKVKCVFACDDGDKISQKPAEFIIERALQKLETRIKYASG